MGQKHKRFREFRTPFPLRDVRENPRSNVRACAAGDEAICSKNRNIFPYHGTNPNTRNGARLRSPSLIVAPAKIEEDKYKRLAWVVKRCEELERRNKFHAKHCLQCNTISCIVNRVSHGFLSK